MKLKELRKNLNRTQQEIADDLGFPLRTYHAYESGETEPNINKLKIMSKYFHVSVDYLIDNNSHLLDLHACPIFQKELIEQILNLNEIECVKMEAYLNGLMQGKKEFEYLKNKKFS